LARNCAIALSCKARFSSKLRPWLRCWNVLEAQSEIRPRRSNLPVAIARSRPRPFSHSAEYDTPGLRWNRRATSSASAMLGTFLGFTKLVTWMCCTPVSDSASTSSTLRWVGMSALSIWKPSRGPSSLI
jgi:hypothetical protein